jgi:small subunit ribosomal protein S16
VSVKLRLMRVGKKKQPTYRIVAADSRSPRDGRFIEIVGTYQPRSDPSVVTVQKEKALDWLSKGAQPTETVHKLLEISGVWSEYEATKPAKKAEHPRPSRAGKSAGATKAGAAKAGTAKASARKTPAKAAAGAAKAKTAEA